MCSGIIKKILASGLVVFCILVFPLVNALQTISAKENTWTTMSPIIARRELMVTGVNGKIYAIGGMDTASCLSYNQEYDPASDIWAIKTQMPTARADAAITIYQNRVFVIGGITGAGVQVRYGHGDLSLISKTGANEVYDPATDTWETKLSLPVNMSNIRAGVVDGKIYVVGGKTNLMYDPANNSWTNRTPPLVSVWKYALTVINNSLWLFGGVSSPDDYSWSNITQVYNPKTDQWSYGTPLPGAFIDPVAVKTTGEAAPVRVYIISFANRTNVYDPAKNSWSIGAQMSTQRAVFGAAVANDLLYVVGGGSGTFPTLYPAYGYNEQYTPIGYGVPDLTYQTPTPIFSQSPTPSQSPSPTTTPTLTPTQSIVPLISPSENPTGAPKQIPRGLGSYDFVIEIILVVALAIILVIAVAFIRKRKPN
jgi:N-acetylneuraminic acid mutarotase